MRAFDCAVQLYQKERPNWITAINESDVLYAFGHHSILGLSSSRVTPHSARGTGGYFKAPAVSPQLRSRPSLKTNITSKLLPKPLMCGDWVKRHMRQANLKLPLPNNATSAAAEVSFPNFSGLPYEIRVLIWQYSLPGPLGPSLFRFRAELWRAQFWETTIQPAKNRKHFEIVPSATGELRLDIRPYEEHIGSFDIDLPIAFVNREAQNVAVLWLQGNDVDLLPSTKRRFRRRYDRKRDAMYIPYNVKVFEQCRQGALLRREADDIHNVEHDLFSHRSGITQIALPESLFERIGGRVADLLRTYPLLRSVLVVVDTPPKLDDPYVMSRWEFTDMPGGSFKYERESRSFVFEGGRICDLERVYTMIENRFQAFAEHESFVWFEGYLRDRGHGVHLSVRLVRASRSVGSLVLL